MGRSGTPPDPLTRSPNPRQCWPRDSSSPTLPSPKDLKCNPMGVLCMCCGFLVYSPCTQIRSAQNTPLLRGVQLTTQPSCVPERLFLTPRLCRPQVQIGSDTVMTGIRMPHLRPLLPQLVHQVIDSRDRLQISTVHSCRFRI